MYSTLGRRRRNLDGRVILSLPKLAFRDFLHGNRHFPCLNSANTCKFACKITKKILETYHFWGKISIFAPKNRFIEQL